MVPAVGVAGEGALGEVGRGGDGDEDSRRFGDSASSPRAAAPFRSSRSTLDCRLSLFDGASMARGERVRAK